MNQPNQQKTLQQPAPIPPELADPPGRKVTGVFICRATSCGTSTVSYDGGEPAKCRNARCSGKFSDEATRGRWLKCRDDNSPEAQPAREAAIAAAGSAEPFVGVGGEDETRVSSGVVSAADYRGEWVAERVAAFVDRSEQLVPLDAMGAVWESMAALYDEGKRRGHLP